MKKEQLPWMVLFAIVLTFNISGEFYQIEVINDKLFDDYSLLIPGSEVNLELVAVPGGIYFKGSPEQEKGRSLNEGPQKKVEVDSFWMGKYEVTWNQYDLFINDAIIELKANEDLKIKISSDAISSPTQPYVDMTFGMGRDGYPAINMTHYAAVMFAKWLTAKTGEFYRLPTEAEWEYACRAGSNSAYYFGDSIDKLDLHAWYRGNSDRSYKRVGMLQPNKFGLYDLSGNVAEWTMDQYYDDYFERLEGEPAKNPWFKPDELYPRSVRGGSWQDEAEDHRCAKRRGSEERWKQLDPQMPKSLWWHTSAAFVGFRVVRPKKTPSPEAVEEYWIRAIEDF